MLVEKRNKLTNDHMEIISLQSFIRPDHPAVTIKILSLLQVQQRYFDFICNKVVCTFHILHISYQRNLSQYTSHDLWGAVLFLSQPFIMATCKFWEKKDIAPKRFQRNRRECGIRNNHSSGALEFWWKCDSKWGTLKEIARSCIIQFNLNQQ